MTATARILAFSGSTRRGSLNQKLLNAVVEAARAAGGQVTAISLADFPLPLYDGDLEEAEGMPVNAQKLVALIAGHGGLLIASPEYNSQITPVLKNALDWCTRAEENPLKGRVAAVVSASPGLMGGIRSMTLARQLLTHLGCHVIPAQCILPQAHKAFDAEGALLDERARKAVHTVAGELVAVTGKLGA